MRTVLITLALAVAFTLPAAPAAARSQGQQQGQSQKRRAKPAPRIDMVIALDTSGSMSGLINAARQKLWDIVNEAARAKPAPVLRVGLVTFGSSGSEKDGYVIVQSPLTTDLDAIYEKLFALRTSGGTEYVGRAVHRSLHEMDWHRGRQTLRQIFVAGNESADQDRRVRAATAVRNARKRGIFVNAIFCGSERSGVARSWQAVARGGRGVFAAIDHNHGTVMVATPYDAKINALSAKLNRTYVAYGRKGRAARANQARQDKNALRTHSAAAASRAKAKASAVYRADNWDLVDARRAGKLAKIKKEELPAVMQAMSVPERKAYLDKKEKERKQLKAQIRELSKKRDTYAAAEKAKQGKSEGAAFDHAVKRAIRVQAASQNIAME